MNESGEASAVVERMVANCDQEAWVRDLILTAIRMSIALHTTNRGRQPLMDCGIDGVANGAAVEIIRTLGMEPEFANLRRPNAPSTHLRSYPR